MLAGVGSFIPRITFVQQNISTWITKDPPSAGAGVRSLCLIGIEFWEQKILELLSKDHLPIHPKSKKVCIDNFLNVCIFYGFLFLVPAYDRSKTGNQNTIKQWHCCIVDNFRTIMEIKIWLIYSFRPIHECRMKVPVSEHVFYCALWWLVSVNQLPLQRDYSPTEASDNFEESPLLFLFFLWLQIFANFATFHIDRSRCHNLNILG